jgi:hypothetical protein
MTIEWKTEKRKLKDLIPYEKNPRILTDKQKSEIRKSLNKFDLVEIPAINADNTIIAGHQRISILKEIKGDNFEIEVRVPSKKLNEKDFQEYLLRSNRNKAEWDWNMLETDFSTDLLLDSGFEAFEIDVDKLNIDECFSDMDTKKKKVKVKECIVCKKSIGIEVKFILRDSSFDNYNFKDASDESKRIYELLKDHIKEDRKIHVIIENNSVEEKDETIFS